MTLQGFLLINKPLKWTSFDVIAALRKKFQIKRIGHTGTLDPLATGLMVIGVGRATRFLEFHVGHDKTYEAEITFGSVSETYDAEGPITKVNTNQPIKEDIEKALDQFRGEIEQVPPKYSALKINGQKLCNLVREGKEVDIEAKKRNVTIFENTLLEYNYPVLKLRIHCSSGTYIRSIAHDLGQSLGCGAFLSGLNRTKVENFELKDAKDIEYVSEQDLLSLDIGLEDISSIELNEDEVQRLKFGQKLESSEEEEKLFRVYTNNAFQGITEIQKGKMKAKKMIV